jgi:hypothetical protein
MQPIWSDIGHFSDEKNPEMSHRTPCKLRKQENQQLASVECIYQSCRDKERKNHNNRFPFRDVSDGEMRVQYRLKHVGCKTRKENGRPK